MSDSAKEKSAAPVKKTTAKKAAKKAATKRVSKTQPEALIPSVEPTPVVEEKVAKVAKKVAKKAAKKVAKKRESQEPEVVELLEPELEKKTPKKRATKTATKRAKKSEEQAPEPALEVVEKAEPAPVVSNEQSEEPVEVPRIRKIIKKADLPAKPVEENPEPKALREVTPAKELDPALEEERRAAAAELAGFSPEKPKPLQKNQQRRDKRRKGRRDDEPVAEEGIDYGPPVEVSGILEIAPKGFGFLRKQETDFALIREDVFVSPELIRRHGLRVGAEIVGLSQNGRRGPQLIEVNSVSGLSPDEALQLPLFDELKAVNPTKRIVFENTQNRYTNRVIDMIAPVGRGQRGLLVAPPRAGKTTVMQHMAEGVLANYEGEIHLMIVLLDERPEEVTEFKRSFPTVEIFASSNDSRGVAHCRIAELAIERAKRLVEAGKDVLMLMDSITRLARAYNNAQPGKGKTMSGGIDSRALEVPRRLFSAARNTREAGSLTIVATALVQTNSRMDELIFQEFKGTGNMELVLDRKIAEQYIFPAVDLFKSGTRREELLLPESQLEKISLIRRGLSGHRPLEAMERLLFFLKKYHSNAQLLLDIKPQK